MKILHDSSTYEKEDESKEAKRINFPYLIFSIFIHHPIFPKIYIPFIH